MAAVKHDNEDEKVSDLPLGYDLNYSYEDGKLATIDEITSEIEKLAEVNPKNALNRSRYEDVVKVTDSVSSMVVFSTILFLGWMHAMYVVVATQVIIPGRNGVMTNSNIISTTANVVCFVAVCASFIVDSFFEKSKTLVGIKFDNLFGFHGGNKEEEEMVSLSGVQFWVYLPWLAILSFELLTLSCMLEFYNGIDHMIVYLGFVILGYVMVAYTTSCATWLEIRVFLTLIFYSSALFYPAVIDVVANTFPEKSNNTLSGDNVQYSILDYWGNSDLQYRTYFPNGTISSEMTETVATAISSTALCTSLLLVFQIVFNYCKRVDVSVIPSVNTGV
jgi:hypothetical protein